MKKFLLIAFIMVLGSHAKAQNVLNLFAKANSFFELLHQGKYDTAHLYFAESERAKLKPETLKQIWEAMQNQFGKVEEINAIQSKNEGNYAKVLVSGKFAYGEQDFNLIFNKEEQLLGLFLAEKAAQYIPPSYADTTLYTEQSVYLKSGNHQLAAIITKPKNGSNFPMVVMVHGSGPGDMDASVGPNKPFKDFAAGLASQGIASLRYVKRTTVYGNEFKGAFTVKEEVLDDALAAVEMAKKSPNINPKQVFLLGHSLGGMLAPRLASLSKDIPGIILAAAPARKMADLMEEQSKYMVEVSKDTTAAMQKNLQEAFIEIQKAKLTSLGNIKPDSLILGIPASYWIDLNNYNAVETAQKITQKILVLQGGMDFQVSKTDFDIWDKALTGKSNATLKYYPELNHLFSIQIEKGTMAQYQVPDHISGKLINDVVTWIKAQ